MLQRRETGPRSSEQLGASAVCLPAVRPGLASGAARVAASREPYAIQPWEALGFHSQMGSPRKDLSQTTPSSFESLQQLHHCTEAAWVSVRGTATRRELEMGLQSSGEETGADLPLEASLPPP